VSAVLLVAVAPNPVDAAAAAPMTPAGQDALGAQTTIRWKPCPTVNKPRIRSFAGFALSGPPATAAVRKECGTVEVPLDYAKPGGRKLRIAVSRVRASDTKNRLGVLLLNPGGPGGAGLALPEAVLGTEGKALGERFDLIGFDPRGVGVSTRLRCTLDEPTPPADITEEAARQLSIKAAKANAACAATDPTLTRELTTPNVARDMDRIRIALGERKLNYLGISWGTALGAHYRTLFANRVGRLVIDSPVTPDFRWDQMYDDLVAARQANHVRFTTWVASNHEVYGLGATARQVQQTLGGFYDRFSKKPEEVPGIGKVDGPTLILAMYALSDAWPRIATALSRLKKAVDGTPAKELGTLGAPGAKADEPEDFNVGVQIAITCNEDAGTRDFQTWWSRYERRRDRYPLATQPVEDPFGGNGFSDSPVPLCAGWPHPVRPYQLANTGAPLLIVDHAHEWKTPANWGPLLQRVVGGARLRITDDGHGSLITLKQCMPAAVSFLTTGQRPTATCQVPLPKPVFDPND
jgi:pimeloyl-ACP methyl ester carboxylesterase